VEQNLESLCTFFDSRGRFEEGKVYCHMVAVKLEHKVGQSTNSPYEHGPLSIKTLAWQAHFTREREQAFRLLNQSQDILDRTGSQGNGYLEAQALVWDFFGHHYSWEDREKSRYYFGKSQELFYQIGDEWSEAETQTDLGWVSWVIGAFEEAQSLIEASLKKHKRVGNQLGESHSLTLLAVLNKHLGRLEEAERMHRESLDLLQDLNTPWEIANGHQVYSHTLCINGKYDQALTHAHLSLQIYNDLGYSGPYKAKPHVGISSALMDLGENSSARSHSQKSLQIARRNGNLQGVGISLLQLGKLALVEDDYETARQFFQESHEILVEIKQNIFIIPVAFLSLVARGFGQEDNANLYLLQSLQGVRNTTDYISGVTVLLTAAVLAVDRGQVERGIEYYALASNTPVFASSSWYKDVIQRDIVTASKSLPQEIVKAAEVRGRSLDLWASIHRY
jgi:tetratricopeptide (TPR) repeat protein